MAKKVYNKKRTNYKGSIPGMRKGGSLPKARRGLGRAQNGIDENIYTLGTDTLGNPIEGSSKPIGNTMNQEDLYNKLDSLGNVMNENVNRRMDTEAEKYKVADSLRNDAYIKGNIRQYQEDNDWFDTKNKHDRLQLACMRGDASACKQLGTTPEQLSNENISEYEQIQEWQNEMDQKPVRVATETPLPEVNYKRGGTIKKRRGGTILGGKYKMKKGGSTGRNGIL